MTTTPAIRDLELSDRHFTELVERRRLDRNWIETNCRSLTAQQASQRLGYPAKSGGIFLEGHGIQIQFKPDKPWKKEEEKKAAKYRSPLGDYDAMLPVHPNDPTYWTDFEALKQKCYQVDGHPCLVVTEGFFKAIAGCSNEIPTIALLGVEMGLTSAKADVQGKRYLVPKLEKFARERFGFIIAFDADCAINKNVTWAQQKLAEQLLKFKVPVYSVTGGWTVEQGKGMDDFIQNNGADDFKRDVLGKALSHEEWLESVRQQLEQNFESDVQSARSRFKQRYQAVKNLWDGRLRFNTLKQQVELDGKPLDLDFVRAELCITLDIDIPKEEAVEIVLRIARENEYCPIVEYLESVSGLPPANLDALASDLLRTDNPLHAAYVKRHLIGSVARAFTPGCKMDTALILQGKQGIKKSTFFNVLYGDGFFDDTMTETNDKDEVMKLHQHWAVEWAEFESTLSRRGYSRLKAFMTTQVDNFRPPYGRSVKSCPRHSVLVGSTNEAEFLSDPSGDRRFWVIPIKQPIDTESTLALRDSIWAAAVQAYRAGERWWLSEEEKQWADEANKPFRVSDTWEDFIFSYIQGRTFVTIAEVLGKALEIEASKQDKNSQMRASAILRRFGWEKGLGQYQGKRVRGWLAPVSDPPEPPSGRVDLKVDQVSNPYEINTFSFADPPDPPPPPTFSEQLSPSEAKPSIEVATNKTGDLGKIEKEVDQVDQGGSVGDSELPSSPMKSGALLIDPPTEDPLHGWAEHHAMQPYPNPKSDILQSSKKRALEIRKAYRSANCKEELAALREKFSEKELVWVHNWLKKFFPAEFKRVNDVAAVSQPSFFD
jgi:predicted P-loop ATPase